MALEMVFEQDYHAEENNVIDWQSYVFDSDFIKSVDKLAIRRFGATFALIDTVPQRHLLEPVVMETATL